MFRKRVKKFFPEGTFIPTPARVLAIIQLCLAFSAILWNAADPFMGKLFSIKSQLLLQEHVLTQKEQFLQLPTDLQDFILTEYAKAQKTLAEPFSSRIKESLRILIVELPLYERAWLLFSVLIPILLLKKVEGAQYAIWILPLIAGVYGIHNYNHGISSPNAERALFPTEDYLVSAYLDEPLSTEVLKQQDQLKQAWEQYITAEWKSEYFFHAARIQKISQDLKVSKWKQKQPELLLYLYFFWNVLVAGVCSFTLSSRQQSLPGIQKAQEG